MRERPVASTYHSCHVLQTSVHSLNGQLFCSLLPATGEGGGGECLMVLSTLAVVFLQSKARPLGHNGDCVPVCVCDKVQTEYFEQAGRPASDTS